MGGAPWMGRRVLITGHTGFKGAWLALWLREMGAQVSGFSLPEPVSTPDLYSALSLDDIADHRGDLRNEKQLEQVLQHERPEIVFHMAAQSLVRPSYADPVGTFETNVMGTVKLLDALRRQESVRACIVVTSDKCYENQEQPRGYRENDPMGGHDPYSASKGAAEIATSAMRRSFFAPSAPDGHPCRIATARAGNVIGGGDWSDQRLVPDIVRGCLGPEGRVVLRAPGAVRPWQHVLEPLHGYILLAEALLEQREGADSGWNFGPDEDQARPVRDVARALVQALGQGQIEERPEAADLHEAKLLMLDASRARELGWRPVWDFGKTISQTASWYARQAAGHHPRDLCLEQIEQFSSETGA